MRKRIPTWLGVLALSWPAVAAAVPAPQGRVVLVPSRPMAREEKTGTLPTEDGRTLRVSTDVGHVTLLTQGSPSGQVSYRVSIETDARQPDAAALVKQFNVIARATPEGIAITGASPFKEYRGRLSVRFEIRMPRAFNADVSTHAGNLRVEDIEGRVSLVTAGGSITAGRINGSARLETQGGHIRLMNVTGDLTAITQGGHITAGHVLGAGNLKSGGGHIRVTSIRGPAQLETAGGDIRVEQSVSRVSAVSGGGQILFGEAAGTIEARAVGGRIQVQRVSGPMHLASGGGNLFLTRVQAPVNATTKTGSITAVFGTAGEKKGPTQLECQQGDIVVYLSPQLPLSIEATIEKPEVYRLEVDPLLVKWTGPEPATSATTRFVGAVNGGGEVLRLRAVSGNIRIRRAEPGRVFHFVPLGLDANDVERIRQQMLLMHQQMEQAVRLRTQPQTEPVLKQQEKELTGLQEMMLFTQQFWANEIVVSPEFQERRIAVKVRPEYPSEARVAKVEGMVLLSVVVGEDGKVVSADIVSGHPLLRAAAREAVQQWKYQPIVVRGKPAKVKTRVSVKFSLQSEDR